MHCGVDIGGTNTRIGILDKEGRMRDCDNLKTACYTEARDLIVTIAYSILRMAKVGGFEIESIGVGCPNVNPFDGTLENAANLKFKGKVSLRDEFRKYFPQIPLAFDNDANAAAIGEKIYGKARDIDNYISFTLGTGIGGGVVCDGKLIYGLNGMAGELGHIIIRPGQRACGCGRSGCLEQYAAANGIFRTYRELCTRQGCPPRAEDYRQLAEIAMAGDPTALETYRITGEILGLALANIACVTAPTHIFLFGGVAQVKEILLQPLRESFYANLLGSYGKNIRIELSALMDAGKDAAILGAAALACKA